MSRIQPGTFCRKNKRFIALSNGSSYSGVHGFDIHDAVKGGRLRVVVISGCEAVPAADLVALVEEGNSWKA